MYNRPESNERLRTSLIINIIIGVDMIMLVFSFFCLIITHGSVLDSYIFLEGNDRFMDFFNHIGYTADLKRTYYADVNANAPAFAYLLYSFLYHIMPKGSVINFNSQATSSYALLIFVIYNIVICSAILYNVVFLIKPCFRQGFMLCMCFFFILCVSAFRRKREFGNYSIAAFADGLQTKG